MPMAPFAPAAGAVLAVLYPDRCTSCGALPTETAFCARGPRVAGLRPWDRPSLCESCLSVLAVRGPRRQVGPEGCPELWGAVRTDPGLVQLVGAFKYHGVRGLAWPLAGLMEAALAPVPPGTVLVPVPLHRRRRRSRGFNQAAILARLVGRARGLEVQESCLVRRRATAQQARITAAEERRENLAGAFAGRKGVPGTGAVLVDDLVTSGATVAAAAGALAATGWTVRGVLALGLASSVGKAAGPVDTGRGDS